MKALEKALGPLGAEEREEMADGLAGATSAAAEARLAERQTAKIVALEKDDEALPQQLGLEAAASEYVTGVITMEEPHLKGLLEEALARLPADRRAIVLAEDIVAAEQSLREAGTKRALSSVEWILGFQDQRTHEYVQENAYRAGEECVDGCPNQLAQTKMEADDVGVLPLLIQHDVTDCIYTPVCTAAERQGIEEYVEEQARAGRKTYDTTKELGAFMQFDSELATESWIEAFA